MKNKILKVLASGLALISVLCGCGEKEQLMPVPDYPIKRTDSSLRIAVASDLHVGADESANISFEGNFSPQILDAFASDLVEEDVDLLILSGDISNSSRYEHHEQLIEKLSQIEKNGIQVCVIDGNHDIGKMQPDEFADYYQNFGYSDAVSRDENSLSYAFIKDRTMVVMLDTDGYTDYRYARLSENTLSWLETVLSYGYEHKLTILTAGHYPLLTNHTTEFKGKDETLALFEKYNIPLYVSGHLHGRSVTEQDGLTELVVEQLTTYPCSYAILDIDGDSITYQPRKLSVSQWAEKSELTDEFLLHFEERGEQALSNSCESLIDTLCEKNYASNSEKKKRCEFYSLLTKCRTDGTLYKNIDILKSHSGYPIFMRICQGSNYAPWIPVLLESANPYTAGFIIKSGHISALDS